MTDRSLSLEEKFHRALSEEQGDEEAAARALKEFAYAWARRYAPEVPAGTATLFALNAAMKSIGHFMAMQDERARAAMQVGGTA